MQIEHHFQVQVEWQGNRGTGTSGHRDYSREHVVTSEGNPSIPGSAHRAFHGDAERWNPEEMLIAALSQCHMLSYLYVATANGIVVESYRDEASGTIEQTADGGGHFTSVTLRPVVEISAGDPELALALHRAANEKCFIASSVNFPVRHDASIALAPRT